MRVLKFIREVSFEIGLRRMHFSTSKKAWILNLSHWGTGIPNTQQASPRPGREHYAYPLVCSKITSFQCEIQSEMLLIFYFKKFRKYINMR